MNATATTKPADTTQEKAINKMSHEELEAKRNELNAKLDDPKNLDQYDALSKQKKEIILALHKLNEVRVGEVEDISNKIVQHKIKLSELSPEARQALGAVVAQAAEAGSTRRRGVPKGTPRNIQKTGAVLITIPSVSGRGAAPTYNKGQELGATVGPSWKAMYEANKDNFAAALAAKFSDEGKTYFATEEGKAELAKFVEWVKTKPASKPVQK